MTLSFDQFFESALASGFFYRNRNEVRFSLVFRAKQSLNHLINPLTQLVESLIDVIH
jgi:hypothetical protein